MSEYFACVIPGRAIDQNFVQRSETQFTLDIASAELVNHVAVFLLKPLPDPGLAITVHFYWPSSDPTGNQPGSWRLMGGLTNQKPSAIYKLSGSKELYAASTAMNGNWSSVNGSGSVVAQLGISVEDLSSVTAQIESLNNQRQQMKHEKEISNAISTNRAAENIAQNLRNFAFSFANSNNMIPVKAFEDWYKQLEAKIRNNQL